jgi:spectinomycin phosphotransferase
MQEKPAVADDRIIDHLFKNYNVPITQVTFLPLGADFNSAVYRVTAADGQAYFLKLRRNAVHEISVALPKLLRDRGIQQVMAPLATMTGQLWSRLDEFHLILYPFVEGDNGFAVKLADHQWVELGAALKRVHTSTLPPALQARLPQESYSTHWCERLSYFLSEVAAHDSADPAAATLAQLLWEKQDELRQMIDRTTTLGRALQARSLPLVVCHTDIHGWNLLVGVGGDLYIVDWDTPMLAPKERDLMFLVGGVADVWQQGSTDELFYQGYGEPPADPAALAYYRYARVVEDIGVTCEQIFLTGAGGEDRTVGVQHVANQFLANGAVELAYKSDVDHRQHGWMTSNSLRLTVARGMAARS